MTGTMSIIATCVGKSGKNLPLGIVPSYCRGLAVDSTGTVYVAATGSRSVLKITAQGKVPTLLPAVSPGRQEALLYLMVKCMFWSDIT